MAVIISAFSGVRPSDTTSGKYFCINEVFKMKTPLDPEQPYLYDDKREFSVSSSNNYKTWKSFLCTAIHKTSLWNVWQKIDSDDPNRERLAFEELFDVSDECGTFGSNTCHRLYQDFVNYRETVLASTLSSYILPLYDQLIEAFYLGSNSGAVEVTWQSSVK